MDNFILNIDDQALSWLEAHKGDNKFFRFGMVNSGCNGFSYKMEFVGEIQGDETVCDIKGLSVLLKQSDAPFINGTTIKLLKEFMGARLVIDNPNVSSQCGCGTSVGFK